MSKHHFERHFEPRPSEDFSMGPSKNARSGDSYLDFQYHPGLSNPPIRVQGEGWLCHGCQGRSAGMISKFLAGPFEGPAIVTPPAVRGCLLTFMHRLIRTAC